MKEVFEVFTKEIKTLEENLDFLEENATGAHLIVLEEISKTLTDLSEEFDKELLKLAICKQFYFSLENYRNYKINSEYIDERVAIIKHIEKMRLKLNQEDFSLIWGSAKLPDSNNELMVSKLSKSIYPKIECLKDRCYEINKMLKTREE